MRSIIRLAWERFKVIGEINGDYIARFVTLIFYFTILMPFALIARFIVDPLELRKSGKAVWKARKAVGVTLEDARSQS